MNHFANILLSKLSVLSYHFLVPTPFFPILVPCGTIGNQWHRLECRTLTVTFSVSMATPNPPSLSAFTLRLLPLQPLQISLSSAQGTL